MQDAFATADGADECQRWHRRLHHYLDWLFQKDSQLGGAFAELQVGPHLHPPSHMRVFH